MAYGLKASSCHPLSNLAPEKKNKKQKKKQKQKKKHPAYSKSKMMMIKWFGGTNERIYTMYIFIGRYIECCSFVTNSLYVYDTVLSAQEYALLSIYFDINLH